MFRQRWTRQEAPAQFTARFETSKGSFDVAVTRAWSPAAADRFYQLVRHHYYDSGLFYRVVPGFVAQFGQTDSVRKQPWSSRKVPDEPVLQSNVRARMSFARDAPETRRTELFINLKDNPRLDTVMANGVRGYPPFGEVVRGMDVVDSLYGGYGGATMQQWGAMHRNPARFRQSFPLLDGIRRAYILRR